jgi:hypothetical protein
MRRVVWAEYVSVDGVVDEPSWTGHFGAMNWRSCRRSRFELDRAGLDEAIDWAEKIPTACVGGVGSIEVRPMRFQLNEWRIRVSTMSASVS